MASLRVCQLMRAGGRVCWRAPRYYSDAVNAIPLTFSSPKKSFYDSVEVKQVDVSSTTGTFGILPNHVPAISVLKPGPILVYEGEKITKFFASSGTATINADGTVQILVEEAYPLEDFDIQAARSGLEQSQQKASSATSEPDKAEALVGVELYEALVKALE